MSQVISFVAYRPPARFDLEPWTDVRIEEGASEDGPFTEIDLLSLGTPDADPSDPAARSFTTSLASDEPELWYRVVFLDAGLNESQPTTPVQNVASTVPFVESTPYATVDQLAQLLKLSAATQAAREDDLTSVLTAAAEEIDAELGRTSPFDDPPPDLVVQVNLERAVEHWHARPVGFGIIGLDTEAPVRLARDTWDRHAHKLAPLKETWGLA